MGQDAPTRKKKPQPTMKIKAVPTPVGLRTRMWRIRLQPHTNIPNGKRVVIHNSQGDRDQWEKHC